MRMSQSKFMCPLIANPLREKCPYFELFWSAFSRIWTAYGESIFPYSGQTRENKDQNNSDNGHFLRSDL